jgi:hypothetical protein
MKNYRESNDDSLLLNAVFTDDSWQAWNSSLKSQALAAIGSKRRKQRVRVWLGRVACAVVLLVGAGWWWHSPAPIPAPVARSSGQPASPGTGDQFITEEQMLAMFPADSCIVAEVNGQKELIFFDAKMAEQGFVFGPQ